MVVAASGLLLTLHYEPSTTPVAKNLLQSIPNLGETAGASAAWYSTEVEIMRDVEFGSLIRSVHRIGVGLLFASLTLFLLSFLLWRSTDADGRHAILGRTWITALVLGMLLLGSGFTGSILPWNVRSFAAAEVVAGSVENSLPLVGSWTAGFLRGGEAVAEGTLGRAFVLHCAWLPLLIALLLLGVAPWRSDGVGESVSRQEDRWSMRGDMLIVAAAFIGIITSVVATGSFDTSSPLIMLSMVAMAGAITHLILSAVRPPEGTRPAREIWGHLLCWLLMMGMIVTMAIAAPTVLHGAASQPIELGIAPQHIDGLHPEWYLMFGYGVLHLFSGSVALLVSCGITLLMFAAPSLERRFGGGTGRVFRAAGIISLIGLLILTIWGYSSLP